MRFNSFKLSWLLILCLHNTEWNLHAAHRCCNFSAPLLPLATTVSADADAGAVGADSADAAVAEVASTPIAGVSCAADITFMCTTS